MDASVALSSYRSRGALTRVRSFVFRQMSGLRERHLSLIVQRVMCELLLIIFLVALNIFCRQISPIETLYSKSEQDWVCETLTELTFVVAGFTLFRALTIDVGSGTNEFVAKAIGLIFFQLAMNISFIVIQFRGMSLNKAIYEKEGYGTADGMPESMTIHIVRLCLIVLGSLVSFSVFVIVFSIVLLIVTASLLGVEEDESVRRWQRNRDLLNSMRHFPFSDILFREASECAICLETFEGEAEIVQLKCSKFHIFHLQCIMKLLDRASEHLGEELKCPLCRKEIEIQDPPIID